jgi:hypothetical protein
MMSIFTQRAIALVLAALLLPSLAAAAGADGYRLAGVLAVGPEYLAILELPGGDQQLVRKGSTLEGGGQVVLVDAHRLRIALSGRTIELNLDGSGAPAQVPLALGVVQEQTDNDRTLVRSLDTEAFSDALARSTKSTTTPAVQPTSKVTKDPAAETGRRLAPILNLPADSRVVMVNEQPVRSADQAIRLIEQAFQNNETPRLNVSSASGEESRVYLMAAQP